MREELFDVDPLVLENHSNDEAIVVASDIENSPNPRTFAVRKTFSDLRSAISHQRSATLASSSPGREARGEWEVELFEVTDDVRRKRFSLTAGNASGCSAIIGAAASCWLTAVR